MTQTSQPPLAVLGAGAWGTVLAWLLAQNGHPVRLWARRPALAERINAQRENPEYLSGLRLPETLRASHDLAEVTQGVAAAVVAVPSRALRDVMAQLPGVPALVSASKGLERSGLGRLSQVMGAYQPRALLAALSGPNLSREIAEGKPAAATLASSDPDFAAKAQAWFSSEQFRVYTSPDLIGVEVAGAVKNVIALAAGLCDGLVLGDNAKATLITRGLAEMLRLGTHLGGHSETFYGLAGLGDLIATCASQQSRNHTAGVRLARGATLADIEASGLTAEGVPTAKAVQHYALEKGLELPICAEVYRVVYEAKAPRAALHDLMAREMKAEW